MKVMNIQELSTSERILLAEQLWDSVRTQADEIELTADQLQLLEDRLAALEADGELGDSWQEVKTRVMKT
jgi:putative addiction module component (TIGR02574 family)